MTDDAEGAINDTNKGGEFSSNGATSEPSSPWIPTMPNTPEGITALAERGVRDMIDVVSSLMGGGSSSQRSPFGARQAEPQAETGDQTAEAAPMAQAFRTIDTGADALKKFVEYFYSQSGNIGPTPEVLRAEGIGGAALEVEWLLHNASVDAIEAVQLSATPLITPDGRTLNGDVGIDPIVIDVFHERSARTVVVSVALAADAEPGVYRGLVQASGLDAGWKAVEITVRPN